MTNRGRSRWLSSSVPSNCFSSGRRWEWKSLLNAAHWEFYNTHAVGLWRWASTEAVTPACGVICGTGSCARCRSSAGLCLKSAPSCNVSCLGFFFLLDLHEKFDFTVKWKHGHIFDKKATLRRLWGGVVLPLLASSQVAGDQETPSQCQPKS